jgi:hypothetical protein
VQHQHPAAVIKDRACRRAGRTPKMHVPDSGDRLLIWEGAKEMAPSGSTPPGVVVA